MKRVVRVEKRKELLSLSLAIHHGKVRSFLSAQMSDDHVMSHTHVLSLKEGNTRAEKRGLDSVSKREGRERGGKRRRWEERERGIFSSRLSTLHYWWGDVGKKGEKRRGRGRKRARTRRRRPNGGLVWMLCLSFPLARYRPEHSRPIPEGKAKVAVTTTGEEKISKPRLVTRPSSNDER